MIGVINDHKFTIVYEWSQQCSQHQNLYRMEPIILKFYNIDWVRRLQARISTIMNDWSLQWPEVYKYEWRESTMLPASRLSKKGANNNSTFYNIDWIRGLQGKSIYYYAWVVSSMSTRWPF